MAFIVLVSGFVLSISTTSLLIPAVRRFALSRGWVDRPDDKRKLHRMPIPPIGGVAIAAGFGVGLFYISMVQDTFPFEYTSPSIAVLIGLAAMVVVGLYDDVRGLSFKGKLAMQFLVAGLLIGAGYQIDLSHLSLLEVVPAAQNVIGIPLTVLWIVGIINAVNLLDGLDGLAGGVVLIAFVGLAAAFGVQGDFGLIVFAVLITGSLLGFLAHNFNPASIFMGDSGSLFLGCLLAVYSLSGSFDTGSSGLLLLVPVVALGLPVVDTGMSIIRRFMEGKSIWAADRDHIHHRLLRRWSPRQSVLIMYGVAIWFGTAAVLVVILSPAIKIAVLAITLVASGGGLRLLGYLGRHPVRASDSQVEHGGAKMLPSQGPSELHAEVASYETAVDGATIEDDQYGSVTDKPFGPTALRGVSFQSRRVAFVPSE